MWEPEAVTEELFQKQLDETKAKIDALPETERARLTALLEDTAQRHERIKQDGVRMRHALAEWQLQFKYLLFDREATRRERDELRRRLGPDPT